MNDVIDDRDGDIRSCSFDEWIDHFFNYDAVTQEQYWELRQHKENYVLSCSNEDTDYLVFFTRLFEDPVTSLAAFNDTQINFGLWAIMNFIGEGGIYALSNADLPWAERKRAIELMYNVYDQLFEPRCDPTILSHTVMSKSEADERSPLNSVCYMWWDMIGLQGGVHGKPENDVIAIGVMERVLTNLTNPACWESALHGLGHYHFNDKERTERIIDTFLAAHPDLDPRLLKYALAARRGYVQ